MNLKLLVLLSFLILCRCGTIKEPYYSDAVTAWKNNNPHSGKNIVHSLYLVGDAGEIDDHTANSNLVLEGLKEDLSKSANETSLVFLADNIYPHGMPKQESEDRYEAEQIINAQLD